MRNYEVWAPFTDSTGIARVYGLWSSIVNEIYRFRHAPNHRSMACIINGNGYDTASIYL